MLAPTTYQSIIIRAAGYDPAYWWPVEWGKHSAVIKNRATNEIVTLESIEGQCEDNICRNLANDDEDDMHDYRPQITTMGGPR